LPCAEPDLIVDVDVDEIDYVEATGEDLIVEVEADPEVKAEVMTEGDEFIAAMRTQPSEANTAGALMTLEDAVSAQRAVIRRVVR
jgi:hypothetical protein